MSYRTSFLWGILVLFLGLGWSPVSAAPDDQQSPSFRWREMFRGIRDLKIQDIDCSPVNPDHLCCASNRYIYVSVDGGKQWDLVYRFPVAVVETSEESDETQEKRMEELEFSRDDYDEDDLRRAGIIEDDEVYEEISDEDLKDRLINADMIQTEAERPSEISVDTEDRISANVILWDLRSDQICYIGTSDGMYRSNDAGSTWRKSGVFEDLTSVNIRDLAVTRPSGHIVAVTDAGVYISRDQGNRFQRFAPSTPLGGLVRVCRGSGPDSFIVCTPDTVYVSQDSALTPWLTVPVTVTAPIRYIGYSDSGVFLIASADRIWSVTDGDTLKPLPDMGMSSVMIYDIQPMPRGLIIGTNRGILRYSELDNTYRFLNLGLFEPDVQRVTSGAGEEIWAVTRMGIFLYTDRDISRGLMGGIRRKISEGIPTINQVIQAALSTAEIDIARDRKWYRKIKRSAWLPDINLAYRRIEIDWDVYARMNSISVSSGRVYVGPDWEGMGKTDNVYNTAQIAAAWYPQVSISNSLHSTLRKRLRKQYEQRLKLVEQVKRMYFEFVELDTVIQDLELSVTTLDIFIEYDRLMALLDAYTGSFFSQNYQYRLN